MFKLAESEQITQKLMDKIEKKGYSKIPIFTASQRCKGILTVKKLLNYTKYMNQ